MTTIDFITDMFCCVDDKLTQQAKNQKHTQANLYPAEVVTFALLFALKGVGNRAFYRWIASNYTALFPVHDTSCSLKIFRSAAIKSLLPLRSKMHGCLTSMLYLRGYKVGEIVVTHRPRIHGKTKYRNPFRIFRIFWMLLYVRFWWYYTHRPQKEVVLDCSQIREIVKP